jgi:hypothetical protein
MKDAYEHNSHPEPSVVISLALGPPMGLKGKKEPKEAKARQGIAKQKLGLQKMHDSWSRKTGVAGQYRDELAAFIDGMGE